MTTVQDAKTMLFQDSLSDVVRQMRNSRKGEQETIQEALADIRQELKSPAQHVKVTAVVKLTYFAMLGYPGDYGAFNIIEVMADQVFANKRAGYVAAAIILNDTSPVLPLCTALLKRDINSPNHCEASLALYCLSCVCTPDLARDLVSDVVGLLNSPKAAIRKKAVLCLYKMFLQFPEALRPTYPLLKEKLEDNAEKTDNEPAVRGAVVNVLCELARRNPANFLNLVPSFYALLSTIHNNWTLIKVIKVFGYFAPLEPRLGKKLVEPLTNIITTSHAKSVQYECLLAVANGMSKVSSLTKLAVERMKIFAEDRDANLKYLGLEAMSRIMRDNPKLLADQRETILACLADRDPTIRDKALVILRGMVTSKNMVETVNAMFDNVSLTPVDEDWSNLVIRTIIETVSDEDYAQVTDFEWYIAVLMDLSQLSIQNFKHGALIENEFVTICTRVSAARQYAVESLSSLLTNQTLLSSSATNSTQWMVLRAAAFVCGEYPYWLVNKKRTVEQLLGDRMMQFHVSIQAVAVSAVSKILAFAVEPSARHTNPHDGEEEHHDPGDTSTLQDLIVAIVGDGRTNVVSCAVAPLSHTITGGDGALTLGGPIAKYCTSVDPVVQERAMMLRYLVTTVPATSDSAQQSFHGALFAAEIEPVAEGAQEAVVVPPGLDLDAPFCESLPSLVADSEEDAADSESDSDDGNVEAALRAERERQLRRRHDVDAYYLKGADNLGVDTADLPPVEPLDAHQLPSRYRVGSKKPQTISKTLSKPANYVSPPHGNRSQRSSEEPVDELAARLRHIKVDQPIGKDDVLPTIQPYKRPDASSASPLRTSEDPAMASKWASTADQHSAFQTLEIISNEKATLSLQVVSCKAKKDGSFDLLITANLKNASQSHSIYEPAIAFADADLGSAQLITPEGTAAEKIIIGDRLKQGSAMSTDVHIHFNDVPNMSEPLSFVLQFSDKKKRKCEISGQFPLLCKYFMIPEPEPITSNEVNTTVLDALTLAGCVSVSIPLQPQTDLAALMETLRVTLGMTVVDVYRDCALLHGAIVARRKSSPRHIALLLKEDPSEVEGFDRQLTIVVKSDSDAMMQGIVQEVSRLLGVTIDA